MTYNAQSVFTHSEYAAGVAAEATVLMKQFEAAHGSVVTAQAKVNLAEVAFNREVEFGARVPELYDGEKLSELRGAYYNSTRGRQEARRQKDDARHAMSVFRAKVSLIALHLDKDGEPLRRVEAVLERMEALIKAKDRA